jgi:hypothetical protein
MINFGGGIKRTLTTAAVGAVLLAAAASPGRAQNLGNTVFWETIRGIAQAGNVVGGITGGGDPWSTRTGSAFVNLETGSVHFEVNGLVLAGGNTIGTPGAVTQVKGTLICGPASGSPVVIDTPLVPLSAQGNAEFNGSLGSSTGGCSAASVAFLIRVSAGAWIGNGAIQVP